jgi:hypothetical protein
MKDLGNASYFDCIEVRHDISPIQKEYTFYYDDMEHGRKILCVSTLSHLLLKLRVIKVDISVSREPF